MAQEEGTRKQFKNQITVRNAEWKDETNCQDKRDQNNEIVLNVKSLLTEEIHQASGGRNVLNQYQKKGFGNSEASNDLTSEEGEINKCQTTEVSGSNFILKEEIYYITDNCVEQKELTSESQSDVIKSPASGNDARNSSQKQ